MNTSVQPAIRRRRTRRHAFALVITLLILSLLIIVAVSYLSSMVSERQTASAYTGKSRAEQAAQTGVDSAMAILMQAFRDYPDSATVWDTQQTINSGSSSNAAVVGGPYNEGTTLYLRAAPTPAPVPTNASPYTPQTVTVANPLPDGPAAPGGTPVPANSITGNNPSNPNCSTFVLPLISGVPGGQARLASAWAQRATATDPTLPPPMKLNQADPVQQNWVDLNVRRHSGDLQGVIGSPPDWPVTSPGPKPARAYWVTVNGSDGFATNRYAFWIEDNSFRANLSQIDSVSNPTTISNRVDNKDQPTDTASHPRSLLPSDISLPGLLSALDASTASANASTVLNTRAGYPGSFFPDSRAFAHASLTPPSGGSATNYADQIAYLTTAQSGALNLSRHGTQRLNLDAVVPAAPTPSTSSVPSSEKAIQSQIEQIVRTIVFHLPNFGQHFYRTSASTAATALNDATQVNPGQPLKLGDAIAYTNTHSLNYVYKVATNIRDFIDSTSTQPTFIQSPTLGSDLTGQVYPHSKPSAPLADEAQPNQFWAQGKKNTPLIQQVAVRYRPICATTASPSNSPQLYNYSKTSNHFDLQIDYYVQFWNMSDQDIYAKPQSANAKALHLNGASVIIRDPQAWSIYSSGDTAFKLDADPAGPRNLLPPTGRPTDPPLEMDLTTQVTTGDGKQTPLDGSHAIITPDGRTLYPDGVVFPAGCVTVVTSDPSCYPASGGYSPVPGKIQTLTAPYTPYTSYNAASTSPVGLTSGQSGVPGSVNPQAVFTCGNLLQGARRFAGTIQPAGGGYVSAGGVQMILPYNNHYSNYVGEVSLVNSYGYLDVVRNAIEEYNPPTVYVNTWKQIGYSVGNNSSQPNYGDFSFVSSLCGNAQDTTSSRPKNVPAPAISQLGDPRTNNEQINISDINNMTPGGSADQSRYYLCRSTLGYLNNLTMRADGTSSSAPTPLAAWPDYFTTGTDLPTSGTYPSLNQASAPMVIANASLTSIGQLGDVFDPARLPAAGGDVRYSRGGGRTLKIGQHDDRYDATPSANNADGVSPSNGWATWRLADIFSAYPLNTATSQAAEPLELPARINVNGVLRDNGAALRAALTGFIFQPATTTNPLIHGDNHSTSSLANQTLNLAASTTAASGLQEIVNAVKNRFNQATGSLPYGPMFERGELGELVGDDGQFLFGASPLNSAGSSASTPTTASPANTNLMDSAKGSGATVDMNRTFDHSREEVFRRLSELICTRGDTFTVYAVGQSLAQTAKTSAVKITGTHRVKVTFRLVPFASDGSEFHPAYNANGNPNTPDFTSANAITNNRFAKPDHYNVQILESSAY